MTDKGAILTEDKLKTMVTQLFVVFFTALVTTLKLAYESAFDVWFILSFYVTILLSIGFGAIWYYYIKFSKKEER